MALTEDFCDLGEWESFWPKACIAVGRRAVLENYALVFALLLRISMKNCSNRSRRHESLRRLGRLIRGAFNGLPNTG